MSAKDFKKLLPGKNPGASLIKTTLNESFLSCIEMQQHSGYSNHCRLSIAGLRQL